MNKNVAEAARRIFGNLPHSNVRTGNKVLRKNIIGRKIAEVCTNVPTHAVDPTCEVHSSSTCSIPVAFAVPDFANSTLN